MCGLYAQMSFAVRFCLMGGFQHAGTGKNKKVIENYPQLAFYHVRAKY